LSMIANFMKKPGEKLYQSIQKTLEDLKWSFAIQFTEKLLKNRGHTIGVRSSTGNKDLKNVVYPMESLIEFVGYEKENGYWKKSENTWKRRSRRRQIGDETARKIDKALATTRNEFQLQCRLNSILKHVPHLLFRHPVLGALPTLEGRIMVKPGIQTAIIPRDLADRFTGMNSDDDGDIVYLLPFASQ